MGFLEIPKFQRLILNSITIRAHSRSNLIGIFRRFYGNITDFIDLNMFFGDSNLVQNPKMSSSYPPSPLIFKA